MSDLVEQARDFLLVPAGIGASELERLMGRILDYHVDYADLYFQYSRHESWALEEGQVKIPGLFYKIAHARSFRC